MKNYNFLLTKVLTSADMKSTVGKKVYVFKQEGNYIR